MTKEQYIKLHPITIISLLNKYIKDIIKREYNTDKCKPKIIISQTLINDNNMILVITLTHLGRSYSAEIRNEDNIIDIINTLYNTTM
jgi:hypothetical protein